MPYIWPWPKGTVISQHFGTHPGGVNPPGGHTGIDAVLPVGTPLRAPADGVIEHADWFTDPTGLDNPWLMTDGGGIGVVLNCGPGKPNFNFSHLNSTHLNPGDRVNQGDIIGTSGNTGRWTTGPHCHFEVMLDGYSLQSNTYGRSNPADVCTAYWEDIPAPVVPQGDIAPSLQPGASQRVTAAGGAQRRARPHAESTAIGERFGADLILTFRGYVRGQDPYADGRNVWFVGAYGDPSYFWAGAFEDEGTHDLPDLTSLLFPAPVTPIPPPVPVMVPKYDFVLDFSTINGIAVEKIPAHWDNYGIEFPLKPERAVIHWWNSLANRPSLDSVIGEFCHRSTSKSPHFIVTDNRIIQTVSLSERAFHAGPGGNDWVGIEVDPYVTERTAGGSYTLRAVAIQNNVRGLLEALKGRFGYKLPLILHKDVPGAATACSEIILADVDLKPAVIVPPPVPAENPSDATVLHAFFDWLINLFITRKDK